MEKAKLPTPSSISETLNSKPTNENKLLLIMGLSSVSILTCLSMLEWIQLKKWGFLSLPRKCHKWTHHTLYLLMMLISRNPFISLHSLTGTKTQVQAWHLCSLLLTYLRLLPKKERKTCLRLMGYVIIRPP